MDEGLVQQAVSELIASFPVEQVVYPRHLKIQDRKGSCNPLPIVLLSSSQSQRLLFQPVDVTLLDLLKRRKEMKKMNKSSASCKKGSVWSTLARRTLQSLHLRTKPKPNANSTPPATSLKKARVKDLRPKFNRDIRPTQHGQQGTGEEEEEEEKDDSYWYSAASFREGCVYDYGYKEEFVRNAVYKVGNDMLQCVLQHRKTPANANRLLVGVILKVMTGSLEIVSFESQDDWKAMGVNMESCKFDFSNVNGDFLRSVGSGVVGVQMVCFLCDRKQSSSSWTISRPIPVKRWNDELFREAFRYCIDQAWWEPKWEDGFINDTQVKSQAETASLRYRENNILWSEPFLSDQLC